MQVKLKENTVGVVKPVDMQDGDIGVIVGWQVCNKDYVNTVVQKHDGRLITIGGQTSDRWSGLENLNENSLVRLLKSGDIIEIQ